MLFIFSINWINQYYWYTHITKNIERFLLSIFTPAFRYFLFYISSLLNILFFILLTFPKISLYLSKHFSLFIKKIHTIIFIKTSIYTHFWKEYTKRFNFFIIFITDEIFFFTEWNLIRYYFFMNIYIDYGNMAFILMKFVFFSFSVIKFYVMDLIFL